MLSEDQIREADFILRRRRCAKYGHDFEVQVVMGKGLPSGIVCNECGESWRVFHPVASPTVTIQNIDAPTTVMPKVR